MAVFRPDLYDAALGRPPAAAGSEGLGAVDAFAGPPFDPRDVAGYLALSGIPARERK
jgi:NitT/TauT family transport system ATP-binding protein